MAGHSTEVLQYDASPAVGQLMRTGGLRPSRAVYRSSGSGLAQRDAVSAAFEKQPFSRDSEEPGGIVHAPARAFERAHDHGALDSAENLFEVLVDGHGDRRFAFGGRGLPRRTGENQIGQERGLDGAVRLGQDGNTPQFRRQLPNVPGPVVGEQVFKRFGREGEFALPKLLGVFLEEVPGECRNLRATASKGRAASNRVNSESW